MAPGGGGVPPQRQVPNDPLPMSQPTVAHTLPDEKPEGEPPGPEAGIDLAD